MSSLTDLDLVWMSVRPMDVKDSLANRIGAKQILVLHNYSEDVRFLVEQECLVPLGFFASFLMWLCTVCLTANRNDAVWILRKVISTIFPIMSWS